MGRAISEAGIPSRSLTSATQHFWGFPQLNQRRKLRAAELRLPAATEQRPRLLRIPPCAQ